MLEEKNCCIKFYIKPVGLQSQVVEQVRLLSAVTYGFDTHTGHI